MGKEYTIEEFVREYNDEPITFKTLYFKEVNKMDSGNKLVFLSDSVLLKYNNDLRNYLVKLTMTDKECNKYFYNPKLLSYVLYGTTELWFLLLHANEIYSTSQFSINPLWVYNTSIMNAINTILNLEKTYIDENEESVTKDLLE